VSAATTPASRIQVGELIKTYPARTGDITAVDRVSFDVKEGEFVALLGPSGCGKSTILNMVAGLLTRSGGDIRIDGALIAPERVNPKVGYVFQRDTTFPWRTVEGNIRYGLELRGLPRAEIAERTRRAVAQAGLADFTQSFPVTLSGGMRQRM
jgi:NitT/TauT family transport system ATP-binding protein